MMQLRTEYECRDFTLKLVNGLDGDPTVLLSYQGEGFLFDCGYLETCSNKELLKVSTIFISHTHMDHFIGFDRFLRLIIPHKKTIRIVGPKGIIHNVSSKLNGYLWNLLEDHQLQFKILEIIQLDHVIECTLTNSDHFLPTNNVITTFEKGKYHINNGLWEVIILDHKTPVLSYNFSSKKKFNVNKDALKELNLIPGPWISDLMKHVEAPEDGSFILLNGKKYLIQDLFEKLITIRKPSKFSYLTDIGFTKSNIELVTDHIKGSDVFVCDCSFADTDRSRAHSFYHLSTKQAALLATLGKVETFMPFHISRIYGKDYEKTGNEAHAFFDQFSQKPLTTLLEEAAKEYIPTIDITSEK